MSVWSQFPPMKPLFRHSRLARVTRRTGPFRTDAPSPAMNRTPALLSCALLSCAMLSAPGALAAAEPECRIEAQTRNTKTVVCNIPFADSPQQFEFVASFSGSHDDTELALQPALDDRSLACGAGSKLESTFEDGDITLNCRFEVSGKVGGHAQFRTRIRWHHAEYETHRLLRR